MTKEELLEKLKSEGFSDEIIAAFRAVDRELFVPFNERELAYDNRALPIGYGQTISQPFTIAFMLRLLEPAPGQKILEVGSGSGYVLALLNVLSPGSVIYGTERVRELAVTSKKRLNSKKNLRIVYTPAGIGHLPAAPYDRIIASAAADKLPRELIDQLADGGILVCPVGNKIVKAVKSGGEIETEEHYGFAFVPLLK